MNSYEGYWQILFHLRSENQRLKTPHILFKQQVKEFEINLLLLQFYQF